MFSGSLKPSYPFFWVQLQALFCLLICAKHFLKIFRNETETKMMPFLWYDEFVQNGHSHLETHGIGIGIGCIHIPSVFRRTTPSFYDSTVPVIPSHIVYIYILYPVYVICDFIPETMAFFPCSRAGQGVFTFFTAVLNAEGRATSTTPVPVVLLLFSGHEWSPKTWGAADPRLRWFFQHGGEKNTFEKTGFFWRIRGKKQYTTHGIRWFFST